MGRSREIAVSAILSLLLASGSALAQQNPAAAKAVAGCLAAESEVERIEGVGHFMLVEKPAEVNRRILQFLQRGTAGEGPTRVA